jgi:DNA processing protein
MEINFNKYKLYYKGNIDLLGKPAIAIVGSRNNTEYGERQTIKFARNLAKEGFTIVSGMAVGIDSFAHKGALSVGGSTIAVLPSGFNKIYPVENKWLYDEILERGGLVVSEYAENVEASYYNFLERNKVVCDLSLGVLVVEGAYRSGTSVTANYAIRTEKKVFCIPSSLENSKGYMPNLLIKDGANLVMSYKDILNQYTEINLKKINSEEINLYNEDNVKDEFKSVYKVLTSEPMNIEDIVQKTRLSVDDVNYKLLMLELDGKIISMPGKNYIRKE